MPSRITIPFWFYLVLLFFFTPGMILYAGAIAKKWKSRSGPPGGTE